MTPPSRAATLLFLEDFDAPAAPAAPVFVAEPIAEKLYDEADLAAARASAAAAARSALRTELEDAHHLHMRLALAEISRALVDAGATVARLAEAQADAFLHLLIDVVVTLLPDLAADAGSPPWRTIVHSMKSAVLVDPTVSVFLHPTIADQLRGDLPSVGTDGCPAVRLPAGTFPAVTFIDDANLQPGDVRVAWRNEAASRDTTHLIARIAEVLRAIGSGTNDPPTDHPGTDHPGAAHPGANQKDIDHAI